MSTRNRIGVLTSGGDCPGLNAVLRAVVKSAISAYDMTVVGIHDGYEGLMMNDFRYLKDNDVSGILPRGGTILGTSNKVNVFKHAVKKDNGDIEYKDYSQKILSFVREQKLQGLIVIGGDGTLRQAQKLYELGVPVVGIPKTIDNDIDSTDVTFGFDSALQVSTDAVDRLHTTAESHNRVMVLEVMGRYAGWIALRAGIAGGGDIILVPEIPYDIGKVCDSIQNRIDNGKRFSIVVIAEGAMPVGGEMTIKKIVPDSADPIRLGGIGQVVARQIEAHSDLEARVTVLGHLQRGGTTSPLDRWLATRFGVAAVDLVASGQFGQMVALKGDVIDSVKIKDAIKNLRTIDPESEEVRIAKALGTCFGD